MNYLKFGNSKKFLVFLHGWGADLNSFLFTKDYFQDYTKLYVDFAGFGKTSEPNKPYFVSDYVRELQQLLQNFDVDEIILVAHSFGGRVAVKFAFLNQCNYKNFKLCLVDAAGFRVRLSLLKKFKIWKYKKLKAKACSNEKYRQKIKNYGSDDYKKLSKTMKQTFVNVVNEDLSIYASRIMCKTLIVWGKKDKETKLWMAKKYKKLIEESKLCIIKDSGHFCFWDSPQEFLIILDSFIKN